MFSGLTDKVVVVTGAARGMGRAHCERFAQEGADVIALDLPAAADDLAETARRVEVHGRRCVMRHADVRDAVSTTSALDACVAELGRLDVVVANAGIYPAGANTWDITEEAWRNTLDVNVTGVWHTVAAGIPHFGPEGGSVVIISSTNGLRGTAGTAHYTASKHAVVGLARTLANELGLQRIRVNTVHPGAVSTGMILNDEVFARLRPDLAHPTAEDAATALAGRSLLPVPWVEPVDVANAVVFLASDAARYITGTQLVVDAGPDGEDVVTGRLDGKVALITGAARGIGRAQALRFAQEGADVIALDVCGPVETVRIPPATPEDLATTAGMVSAVGGRVVTELVDVRDAERMRAVTDRAVEYFGGLDIVCATAGITSKANAVDMPEVVWQTMLDVNLTGVWQTCKVTVPHLIVRGSGSVILVSSIAGLRGLVGVAHYTAAKHGVVGLMRTLANELAPHNIRVNSVHPTNVDTPMIQNDVVSRAFRPDLDRSPTRDEFAEAARSMNMLDVPWVDPLDVANASLFLASEEARFVTASTLVVDAGSTQR